MAGPIMRTFSVLLLVVALFGLSSVVSPRPAVKRFAQGVQPKTLLHAAAPPPAPADSLAPSAGPSAASVHTPLLHHVHVPRLLLPCPSAAAAACMAIEQLVQIVDLLCMLRLRLSDQRLTHQAYDETVALDGAHALLQLAQDVVLVLDVSALCLPNRTRGAAQC